jgi:hypothetical protein
MSGVISRVPRKMSSMLPFISARRSPTHRTQHTDFHGGLAGRHSASPQTHLKSLTYPQ